MPSPFPGMDPYLEGEMGQEFRETPAGAIRARLMSRLPSKYVALLSKGYVIDHPIMGIFGLPPERAFYPDVHVAAPPGALLTTPPPELSEKDAAWMDKISRKAGFRK